MCLGLLWVCFDIVTVSLKNYLNEKVESDILLLFTVPLSSVNNSYFVAPGGFFLFGGTPRNFVKNPSFCVLFSSLPGIFKN